jgi:hypothetical protein
MAPRSSSGSMMIRLNMLGSREMRSSNMGRACSEKPIFTMAAAWR